MIDKIERAVASYLGSAEVNWERLKPVTSFVVLWNRLEEVHGQFLRLPQLLATASRVAASPNFDISIYEVHLQFFHDRYFNGDPRLHTLLRDHGEHDVHDLLQQLVQDQLITNEMKLKAALAVPYRVRNNLFHGRKDTRELYEQTDLFNNANAVLYNFHVDLQRC